MRTKNDKIRTMAIRLTGKELFFYPSAIPSGEIEFVHNLKGLFIKQMSSWALDKISFYPIKIYFNPTKARVIQFKDQSLRDIWFEKFADAAGQRNFEKDYSLKAELGSGKFGKVYHAQHRTTGENVAVKILKRADVRGEEYQK